MKFNKFMHVALNCEHFDEMVDFYQRLGGKIKAVTKLKVYLDRDDRPELQHYAKENPEKIFSIYMEMADGQFIEFFPPNPFQVKNKAEWNSQFGISHYAFTVDDIFAAREELKTFRHRAFW